MNKNSILKNTLLQFSRSRSKIKSNCSHLPRGWSTQQIINPKWFPSRPYLKNWAALVDRVRGLHKFIWEMVGWAPKTLSMCSWETPRRTQPVPKKPPINTDRRLSLSALASRRCSTTSKCPWLEARNNGVVPLSSMPNSSIAIENWCVTWTIITPEFHGELKLNPTFSVKETIRKKNWDKLME